MLDSAQNVTFAMKLGWLLRRFCFGFASLLCVFITVTVPFACANIIGAPLGVSATDVSEQTAHPASPQAGPSDTSLRLGPGDLLEIGVFNVPDFATKTRITSDGDVYLPLINYVHIAGLTVRESQDLIERRLTTGGFVKDPHVTIFVDEYASEGANVLGEVAHPGIYPILGSRSLLDLLSAAGGLSDRAGASVTITHRDQPDHPITIPLKGDLATGPGTAVQVLPGDTVIVRKADIVYVVGDVQRPSGLMMNNGTLTVLQAIAMVGGTTGTAKLNGARIIHKGPTGLTETRVQLQKILQAKLPDVPMRADDILFVPSSSRKVLGSRSFDLIMQTASALSIVAVRP